MAQKGKAFVVTLCGTKNNPTCPTVRTSAAGRVPITDDFGGAVRMKQLEFEGLVRKYRKAMRGQR